ncbi:MAG: O-antigen ligase family protein [Bacteroidetes bacterium]|nr:O-antigen ligase family protein [Bacteroidota bacterium]
MTPLLKYKTNYLYLTGLTLLVTGLPVSLFLTSLSQFFLVGSFFLEGNIKERWKRFTSNKVAVVFVGIWLLHLIGILWTTDLAAGMKDLRIKLPLLLLPIIISGTEKLTEKQFRYIMGAFVFAVFAGTISAIAVLTGIIHRDIYDIRDIFIYKISHIRFALFTCVAICTLVFYIGYRKELTPVAKFIALLLAIWFAAFLVIVESLTGLIVLVILTVSVLIYHLLISGNKVKKVISFVLIVAIPLTITVYVTGLIHDFYNRKQEVINVNDKTAQGNPYDFYLDDNNFENGYQVNIYLCIPELKKAWNERSKIHLDSLDHKKQPIKATLVRFLTSKGMRKDSAAVYSLTKNEIQSIEAGVPNVNFQKMSDLRSRVNQVIWEIDNLMKGGDPSGHSVAQRLEFWRAAVGVIKTSPLFGVGTGDLKPEFENQYQRMNTRLDEAHRLNSHNQYLSIAAAFGIPGLLYFLFALLYPLRRARQLPAIFILFLIICLVSMLTEDTLETQPGATFVGLFFILFYNQRREGDTEKSLH